MSLIWELRPGGGCCCTVWVVSSLRAAVYMCVGLVFVPAGGASGGPGVTEIEGIAVFSCN